MTISELLRWIYCMDLADLIMLLLLCSGVFCLGRKHFSRAGWWKWLVAFLVIVFSAGAVLATLGTRTGGSYSEINLIPFHSYREVMAGGTREIYRSNFMNAVLFYPAGLLAAALLPEKWPRWRRILLVILFYGMLSTGIEYLQYTYALGRCEIDDVIHNTAGALAGSVALIWLPPLLDWLSGRIRYMWAQYDHYRR
jgi:glycopeptide antibiotics resistance protein